MLVVVADLFVRAVAADVRSRQALFNQMVADGLEMLRVAVLRPAVKQDAAFVSVMVSTSDGVCLPLAS